MPTADRDSKFQAIKLAKQAAELMGFGLGNLMYRIHTGNVHKVAGASDWTDAEREAVRETSVFLLGGSICTSGYLRRLLPWYAKRQIRRLNRDLAGAVQIITSRMASPHTGAFGAYYLALPQAAKDKVAEYAAKIRSANKAPILPLIDIGGTKVGLVLAFIGNDGPTFEIL